MRLASALATVANAAVVAVLVAVGPARAQPAAPSTIELPSVGEVALPRAPFEVQRDGLRFAVDGREVTLVLARVERGSCGDLPLDVAAGQGGPRDGGGGLGWWPLIDLGDGAAGLCLDLRAGILRATLAPAAGRAALGDVLAALAGAAYARHGAPLVTGGAVTPSVTLPRTGQVLADEPGELWKVIDGAEVGRPGADALLALGTALASTRHAVTVEAGPCRGEGPGLVAVRGLPAADAATLFPPALGGAWVGEQVTGGDARWTAWVCLSVAGGARLGIVAPPGRREPPPGLERPVLFALTRRLARSYGVDVDRAPARPVAPTSSLRAPRRIGQVALYLGVLVLTPRADPTLAAVAGLSLRYVDPGDFPINVLAFNVAGGVGVDGGLGEARIGLGGARGPVDAVAGLAAASLGPVTNLEGYGQLAATLPLGARRRALMVAGLLGLGTDGTRRGQADVQVFDDGLFLGLRGVWFGGDSGDGEGGGARPGTGALLFTIGGGAVVFDDD